MCDHSHIAGIACPPIIYIFKVVGRHNALLVRLVVIRKAVTHGTHALSARSLSEQILKAGTLEAERRMTLNRPGTPLPPRTPVTPMVAPPHVPQRAAQPSVFFLPRGPPSSSSSRMRCSPPPPPCHQCKPPRARPSRLRTPMPRIIIINGPCLYNPLATPR